MREYILNETGQYYITNFVQNKGKDGLIVEAFFNDAENAANDAFEREIAPILEIGVHMSYDKRPHVLLLDEAWFDVRHH